MWTRDAFVLTDAQWALIEPHCLGKSTDRGRSGRDNRLFMGAVLWIVRTRSPWREPPAVFGNWCNADVFKRIFDVLSGNPDMEYAMIDVTIVKGALPWSGRKGGTRSQAISPSKGGMTTKILALTDALGNLVRFRLMPGQRFDSVNVPSLIDGLEFDAFIADKAFDSNTIIAELNERRHPRHSKPLPPDREIYK